MDRKAFLDSADQKKCLDFLSMMVQRKSYSETDGELVLVHRMVAEMKAIDLDAESHHFGNKGRC